MRGRGKSERSPGATTAIHVVTIIAIMCIPLRVPPALCLTLQASSLQHYCVLCTAAAIAAKAGSNNSDPSSMSVLCMFSCTNWYQYVTTKKRPFVEDGGEKFPPRPPASLLIASCLHSPMPNFHSPTTNNDYTTTTTTTMAHTPTMRLAHRKDKRKDKRKDTRKDKRKGKRSLGINEIETKERRHYYSAKAMKETKVGAATTARTTRTCRTMTRTTRTTRTIISARSTRGARGARGVKTKNVLQDTQGTQARRRARHRDQEKARKTAKNTCKLYITA